MKDMLPCQALFGMSRGAQIQEAIEEDTGEACPCVQGRVCPLTGLLFGPASVKLEPVVRAG